MLSYQLVKNTSQSKSDVFGALASGLCLIHCLLTPFLFLAYSGTEEHHIESPWWWGIIDVLLLALSFIAVYWSVKKTSTSWIKYAFVISWLVLFFIVLNEKLEIIHLLEEVIYIPTLSLIFLHIYNRKYCQCDNDQCCTDL